MEKLKLKFIAPISLNKDEFEQVHRSDSHAVYSRTSTQGRKHYEVFKIREQKALEREVIQYEAKELMPNNEMFGRTAFTFSKLETAMDKYHKMKNKYDKRKLSGITKAKELGTSATTLQG